MAEGQPIVMVGDVVGDDGDARSEGKGTQDNTNTKAREEFDDERLSHNDKQNAKSAQDALQTPLPRRAFPALVSVSVFTQVSERKTRCVVMKYLTLARQSKAL